MITITTIDYVRARLPELRERLLSLTNRYVPSQSRMIEAAKNSSPQYRLTAMDTQELFREYGVPICIINGRLVVPQGEVGSPTSAYISDRPCTSRGGEKIGSFHTHPIPPPAPSSQDMRLFNKEGDILQCIGSKIGEQPVVACYLLQDRDQSEMASLDVFLANEREEGVFGSHGSANVEEIAEINAVERQKLTAMQILDQFKGIVKDVAEENPNVTYNELIHELEAGRVPPVLNQALRTPYNDIDIPVYSKQGQEQLTYDDIHKMERYFLVTVFEG